jgi:molybdopterin-guanine dinucleotide biosynthesis adapter protein
MSQKNTVPPLVSIVGRSNSGKTTLIEKLVPALVRRGVRLGSVKHDVHGFDIDHPGKDSWRHKHAGTHTTIISSPQKLAMVRDSDHDPTLDELLPFFNGLDLVLSEGYKRETKPKIEIFRPEAHPEPLCRNDGHLIALASDADMDLGVPRFRLDDIEGLADFIFKRFLERR